MDCKVQCISTQQYDHRCSTALPLPVLQTQESCPLWLRSAEAIVTNMANTYTIVVATFGAAHSQIPSTTCREWLYFLVEIVGRILDILDCLYNCVFTSCGLDTSQVTVCLMH